MIFPLVLLCAPLACTEPVITAPVSTAFSMADSLDAAPEAGPNFLGTTRAEPAQGSKARPALPAVTLDFPYPTLSGRSIRVDAGDNLQEALNRASRGDEVVLAGGAQFTGNFKLRALPGTSADGWVVIRGDKSDRLPASGVRVTPADGILMPGIITPNTGPAIRFEAGANGWRLVGLEVTVTAAVTQQQYGLMFVGEAGQAQSTMESVPSDIVLDRMFIHGQPTTNLSRCVALNSARTAVVDSHLGDCHSRGFDSQAIGGWNGPGPFRIENNHLEGAGENVMFGGADPSIPELIPSDIEIRRNYFFTPFAWKGVWLKKNLLELKNARRVLVEGNVFDGAWQDGQTGWAVILKSANQAGGCRWCRTSDVTFRRNLIKNSGAGINVAPRGDNPATDSTARRILISENVLENIGAAPYKGDQRGFQLLRGTADITLERNVLSGNIKAALLLEKSPGTARASFRDNVWERGEYGLIASGRAPGAASLSVGAPGAAWSNNTFIGAQQPGYPVGTLFRSSESAAPLASAIRNIVAEATRGVVLPQ